MQIVKSKTNFSIPTCLWGRKHEFITIHKAAHDEYCLLAVAVSFHFMYVIRGTAAVSSCRDHLRGCRTGWVSSVLCGRRSPGIVGFSLGIWSGSYWFYRLFAGPPSTPSSGKQKRRKGGNTLNRGNMDFHVPPAFASGACYSRSSSVLAPLLYPNCASCALSQHISRQFRAFCNGHSLSSCCSTGCVPFPLPPLRHFWHRFSVFIKTFLHNDQKSGSHWWRNPTCPLFAFQHVCCQSLYNLY